MIKEDDFLYQTLIEIQDYLVPRLDAYEQMLYHYLFRHTHLQGNTETTVGIRTMQAVVGLGKDGSTPSQKVITKKMRSLEEKGCLKILSRTRKGTQFKILLPCEIPGVIPSKLETGHLSIEEMDFFNNPDLRILLLKRDNSKCFYCFRKISKDDYTVDHIVPQVSKINHSYMNLVACCFECNTKKQNKEASDYLRDVYREGLLTQNEYKERLETLHLITSGDLKPELK